MKDGLKLLTLLGCLLTTGCGTLYTIDIKTVDAKSRKPISGVSANRLTMHYFIMDAAHKYAAFGPSNSDGAVETQRLNMNSRNEHSYRFSKSGYRNTDLVFYSKRPEDGYEYFYQIVVIKGAGKNSRIMKKVKVAIPLQREMAIEVPMYRE